MKTKELIKEMACYSEKLTEIHRKIFDEILLKVRFSNISERDAEEFSYHCLDLFLQAEQEGVDIETVLGTDNIDAFCNEYIEQARKSYSLLKKALLAIRYIPLVLLIFSGIWGMFVSVLLPEWIKQKAVTFDVPVTASLVVNSILAIGILYVTLRYVGKISLELNYGTKKQDRKWSFVIFLVYLFIVAIFIVSGLYLRQELFHVHFIVFLLICLALDRLFDSALGKMN